MLVGVLMVLTVAGVAMVERLGTPTSNGAVVPQVAATAPVVDPNDAASVTPSASAVGASPWMVPVPAGCVPVEQVCGESGSGAAVQQVGLPLVGNTVSGVAKDVEQTAIKWLTSSVLDVVNSLVGGFFEQSTHPHVTAASFIGAGGAYAQVASVSCLLLIGFVMLGVIQGLLSGESGQALARLLRDIPLAVLAIIGFPWAVDQMLTVADVASNVVLPENGSAAKLMQTYVNESFASVNGGFAQLLIAVAAFAAAGLVYMELVVRNDLTYIVTALSSLSFAAMTMKAARPAARRAVEVTVAIVAAKPAIYVALRIGLDLLQNSDLPASDGVAPSAWGKLLTGVSIILIAGFMPFMVYRLLPIAEQAVVMQGASRAPFRGAMQTMQSAYWFQALWQSRGLAGGRRGPGRPPAPGGRTPGGGVGGDGPGNGPLGRPRSLPDPRSAGPRRPRSGGSSTSTSASSGSATPGGPPPGRVGYGATDPPGGMPGTRPRSGPPRRPRSSPPTPGGAGADEGARL